jgi:hypothetical protein
MGSLGSHKQNTCAFHDYKRLSYTNDYRYEVKTPLFGELIVYTLATL